MFFQTLQIHLEPACLSTQILSIAEERFKNRVNLELLYCCSITQDPEKADTLTPYILKCIDENDEIGSSNYFFQIVRAFRGHTDLILHKYWNKIAQQLQACDKTTESFSNLLNRVSYQYSFFDHGHESKHFEQITSELIMKDIENGLSKFIPKKIANYSTFLLGIGYFHMNDRSRNDFIQKIIDMREQFTSYDILRISRGLQLSLRKLRYNQQIPNIRNYRNDLYKIDSLLDECIEKNLKTSSFNAKSLLIRSLWLRKGK